LAVAGLALPAILLELAATEALVVERVQILLLQVLLRLVDLEHTVKETTEDLHHPLRPHQLEVAAELGQLAQMALREPLEMVALAFCPALLDQQRITPAVVVAAFLLVAQMGPADLAEVETEPHLARLNLAQQTLAVVEEDQMGHQLQPAETVGLELLFF
jgi:hypothetical protein